MIKKLLGAGLVLAVSVVAGAALAQDKMKVGFVYVGPIGDHGWTYQHDQGRLALEAALGDQVETTFIENVAEGADAEQRASIGESQLSCAVSFGSQRCVDEESDL